MANVLTPSLPNGYPRSGAGTRVAENHCGRIRFFFATSSSPFSNPSCKTPLSPMLTEQDSEWMNQKGTGRKGVGKRILANNKEKRRWPSFGREAISSSKLEKGKIKKQKQTKKLLNQIPKTFQLLLVRLLFWIASDSCQLAVVIFFPSPCLNFLY